MSIPFVVARSAERAVQGDLLQGALEDLEFIGLESAHEMPGDPAHVDRHGLGQARDPGIRQGNHDASGIGIGVGPPNQAFVDQPGDTAGHARP